MAVFVAASVSTVFSCKDHEDEIYSDLHGQIEDLDANLTEKLNRQADRMELLKDSLGEEQQKCSINCENERKKLDEAIKNLEALAETHATKAELTAEVEKLQAQISDLAKVSATKAELDEKIAALNDALAKTNAALAENTEDINEILTVLNNNTWVTTEVLNDSLNKIQTVWGEKLQDVVSDVIAVKNQADENKTEIDELKNIIAEIKQCTCDNEELKNQISTMSETFASQIESLETKITLSNDSVIYYYNLAKTYTDDAVKVVADELVALKNEMNETVDSFNTAINALNTTIGEVKEGYEKADTELQEQINALKTKVEALESQVAANTAAIEELTEEITDVKDALSKRISSVVLQGAYSPVVGYFAMPAGVKSNILAAYYGYAPYRGVKFPTVRTANYVKNSDAPFTDKEAELLGFTEQAWEEGDCLIGEEGNAGTLYMTVNPNDVDLTGTEFKLVNSLGEEAAVVLSAPVKSDYKLSFGYTRAGADNGFYEAKATVSADDVKNAKVRIDLEEIKDVVKDVISFDNGVNVTDLITTLYTNINDIADATAVEATWTDSLGEHSVYSDYGMAATAVRPLSLAFYENSNMTEFPGLNKASNFVNKLIDKVNIDLGEFNFDIQAPEIKKIEIKELSEDLLAKFNITLETTVEYVLNMDIPVEDVVVPGQTVVVPGQTIIVPSQTVVSEDSLTEIVIPEQKVVVDGTSVYVDGQIVHIENVKVNETLEIPVTVTYDMTDAVEELYGEMTGSIEDVNSMLEDLSSFMDDINKMLDDINGMVGDIESSIDKAKDQISSELNKYIEKLNTKLCNLVNSANDRLQPTLLIKTTNGFNMISPIKSKPTMVAAESFVLVPTTYTAELLAPAFKKYIAVTNVWNGKVNAQDGDADCLSALKSANAGDLNAVLEGATKTVEFNGKAGYVYEITFSALDYSGKISNTKRYVKIVK